MTGKAQRGTSARQAAGPASAAGAPIAARSAAGGPLAPDPKPSAPIPPAPDPLAPDPLATAPVTTDPSAILDIIGSLLRSRGCDIARAIPKALAKAGEACGADRVQLCLGTPEGHLGPSRHWQRPGLARRKAAPIVPDDAWLPTLHRGEPIVMTDTDPPGRGSLPVGMRSLIAVPMLGAGGLAGCLVLAWATAGQQAGTAADHALLRSLAEAMLIALERHGGDGRLSDSAGRPDADRAMLDLILQTSASAILALDDARRVVFANGEAAALLGASSDRLPGRTLEELGCCLFGPDGDAVALSDMPVARVLASGHALRGEHMILAAADGRRRILSVNAAPVPGAAPTGARVVLTFDDVTEQVSADSALRSALAEAHQLAFFDPLTGHYNRRGIVELLRDCLQSCTRDGTHLALIYVDVDGMRQVNGSRGHWLGDRLLQAVAARLDGLRPEDGDLGRISADEFVLTFGEPMSDPGVAVEAAQTRAEAILAALREPFRLDGVTLEITGSIGLAAISAGDTVEGLLKGVDLAVMAAKSAGGNRAIAYRPDMEQDMVGRVALTQELRVALRQDQFRMHFEPLVRQNPEGLVVVGQEALIRWQHPTRGLLPPHVFIPFAEETGFIRDIDLWVLREGAAELARWRDHPGLKGLQLSINISSAQFLAPGFCRTVREVLGQTGADPARIELEVTEGTLLTNLAGARATMMELRSLGLSIALDDFGTGFSSLSYLRDLPVDVLKIDRSFLAGLSERRTAMTILEGIIGLARGLGVDLVAEGVETAMQLSWLRARGCRTFQGYLFGRPGSEPLLRLPPEVAALGLPDAAEETDPDRTDA